MLYGIDISSNQGKIDFNRVKNAGVEFIVIRATTKNQNPDVRLGEYVKGCCEFEIPFAFYKYMYALSPDGARTEAKSVVSALNKIGVLPSKSVVIYADVEDKTQFSLSTPALTLVVQAFKEEIISSGYSFGLYMSKSPYESKEVDYTLFNDKIWLARYPFTTARGLKDVPNDTYKPKVKNGELVGWQHSSKGIVSGINGYVDLDVFYGDMTIGEVNPSYYATPEFTLIECLNKIGVYPSMETRKRIAIANNIPNYTGTKEQNLLMLALLQDGKLKTA